MQEVNSVACNHLKVLNEHTCPLTYIHVCNSHAVEVTRLSLDFEYNRWTEGSFLPQSHSLNHKGFGGSWSLCVCLSVSTEVKSDGFIAGKNK